MTRKIKTTKTAEQRRAEADALQASIADQVEELRHTEAWTRFLTYAQAFHSYSINNILLIIGQYPAASRVAGFRKWQELGRQVRKGEKAIKIFGFSKKKITDPEADNDNATTTTNRDEGTGVQVKIYYPLLSVFDISQTDPIEGADDLTQADLVQELTGGDPLGIVDTVAAWLTGRGWTFERQPIQGDALGYTKIDGSRRVVVDTDLSPAQAAKTALHEAAHVLLHADETPAEYVAHRGIKETEAESVAYIVAGILGLDTSAYTVGYIAGWSEADTDLIKTTAERVLKAAHTLTDSLTIDATTAAA